MCLVLSKILGIGTAERNWKQVKLIKTGQCSNIHADKCKKQVTLYGQNQQLRARARVAKLSSVGKLWEDGDFKTLKMDLYCKDMMEALEIDATQSKKILQNWQEMKEKKKLGPQEGILLHEWLKKKYVGFNLNENEGKYRVLTVHTLEFRNEGRNKRYMLVCVLDDFDKTLEDDDEANKGKFDLWDFHPAMYDCFRMYYDEFGDQDCVTLYEKGGQCDSKEEEEDE